ncbi:hypothetical protein TVAG_056550 [Trichomonas vaginalis G3]|uniref:Uncharacterized protein n=2 Tax=Trichomonas vaginalis (strain ATCC PRA-98 / G3) TaxID=412133 RepID=A2ECL4_TRIV3|nr:hypothetical protein TVAGG3_0882010 [Trichomonas vaginalis G3]EAY09611.1 hypothetical protein TVAG_056550 [Trichomonas vaginalis G3]KAI5502122.1 hypothetical protein TVAGG3_0882010 [Trichomonas vaginalis G3]|eukprot:XP_001321834.1 hypothetical protein [Trichomonas vaginalis G3]
MDLMDNDDYEEDEELQKIADSNNEANVEYFKQELLGVQKRINKNREKLAYLRKVYQQFAMLINKTVCDNYGPPIVHQKVEKPLSLPIPEIDTKTSNELIHLLTKMESVSPSDVQKFLNNSSVVEKLIFGNQTIFDDQLQNAILRTSPDIRMAFFSSILTKLLRCNKFLEGLLPILSKLSLNSVLQRQLSDPYADFKDFLTFFEESRRKIGETLGFKDIVILFNTGDGDLLYQTSDRNNLLQINNTLVGHLLHCEGPIVTSQPLESDKIQRSEERCFFKDDRACLSMRFSFGDNIEDGLVLLFNDQFTESDMAIMQIVIQYTTPALHTFGTIFNTLTPSMMSKILLDISSLYEAKDIIKSIEQVVQSTLNSVKTKVMTLKRSEEFPNVPILPQDKSLIRAAAEKGGSTLIRLPRLQKGFVKEIDDDTSLSIITVLHIIKIPFKDLFVISYNANDSNSYKIQVRSMVEHLINATPYPIEEFLKRRAVEQNYNLDSTQKDLMENFLTRIPRLVQAVQDSKLIEVVAEETGIKGMKVEVISLIEENNYYVFPSNVMSEYPEEISGIAEPTHMQIDEQNEIFVIPSTSTTSYCVFSGISDYSSIDERLLVYLGNATIVLFPWALMEIQFNDMIHRQTYLRGSMRISIDSISDLIDYNLIYKEYSPPISEKDFKSEKPFHILIETKRGIEASIECDEVIEDDISKSVLESYKDYLSFALSSRSSVREVPSEVFNSIIDYVQIFKCDNTKLMNWIKIILSFFKTNNYDINVNLKMMKFVKSILSKLSVYNWFSDDDKSVIMILLFLNGLENFWRIKADDYLIDLCSNSSFYGAPYVAAVFNSNFGIGNGLSIDRAKHIARLFSYYSIGPKMEQELEVIARVRFISDKGWEKSDEAKVFVGKSLSILSRAEPWLVSPFDPSAFANPKRELIYLERVLLPLFSYYSMKNEFMMGDMRTIRSNIRQIRLQPK